MLGWLEIGHGCILSMLACIYWLQLIYSLLISSRHKVESLNPLFYV